jgi:hypothetical protein
MIAAPTPGKSPDGTASAVTVPAAASPTDADRKCRVRLPFLHRLVPAVRAARGVERVYFLALMERVAHFHLSLEEGRRCDHVLLRRGVRP